MLQSDDIASLLRENRQRWQLLELVESLNLRHGSIGAGFVRNFVWDALHGRASDCRDEDIDVLYFDDKNLDPASDEAFEHWLQQAAPGYQWSVKNQARMHLRNGDSPYRSVADAMRYWPETATAVAAQRSGSDCRILAPFTLNDLCSMILRPASNLPHKREAFRTRVQSKRWLERWPLVRVVEMSALST